MTVSLEMLGHAPRIGARMMVRRDGVDLWVSTVVLAGRKFTRVEDEIGEGEMQHFEGDLSLEEAHDAYMHGAPAAD